MATHVVMWWLCENNKKNQIEIQSLLSWLKDLNEEFESLEVGSNFNRSKFAYDLALITAPTDKVALEKYQKHPEHIIVAYRIKELTKERTVVDFEY